LVTDKSITMASENKATSIRTMPGCTIIPVLYYMDIEKAITWLCDTFGFKERWRIGNHRAQLVFDGGVIAVSEWGSDKSGSDKKEDTDGAAKHSLLVRVKDVNAHYETAQQKGATIIQAPTDFFFGERQYTVLDAGGHVWTFSQTINDLAPEDWGATSNPEV
jgi:uncharacterized glyoxalase superfamily protein PhnB